METVHGSYTRQSVRNYIVCSRKVLYVEITTDPVASAAGPTGTANLSHVSQHTDLSMKSANWTLMSVMTSDNQCISSGDTNPIFSSVTLEIHNQTPSSNVKALYNVVKTKTSIPGRKKVCTKSCGSRPNTK